ncbi:hypothetical protein E4U03_07685 [Rothia nasimurium]|uniref:Tat pathway signal sequence domain protein n=1 Tax=Rothia nasimurium TaxID=85336 RepID=A0A4Y9F2J9_9MICC|nr:hypothetical protein [Rothia nasimurium]MBF0808489.1 hypothetical protein [Rothia nasimurium]TFU21883.1 hypothetical protein E4U03_07685 [Rothia nasimurium]
MSTSRRTATKVLCAGFALAMMPQTKVFASESLTPEEERAYRELQRQFEHLDQMSDREISVAVHELQQTVHVRRAVPLPGPFAILSCAGSAWWIFRDGTDEHRVMSQITDVIMSCIGIPGGAFITLKVSRLIWDHRQKVIAILSAMGLTAAQLAPLQKAPRP